MWLNDLEQKYFSLCLICDVAMTTKTCQTVQDQKVWMNYSRLLVLLETSRSLTSVRRLTLLGQSSRVCSSFSRIWFVCSVRGQCGETWIISQSITLIYNLPVNVSRACQHLHRSWFVRLLLLDRHRWSAVARTKPTSDPVSPAGSAFQIWKLPPPFLLPLSLYHPSMHRSLLLLPCLTHSIRLGSSGSPVGPYKRRNSFEVKFFAFGCMSKIVSLWLFVHCQ